ncbi:Putative 6-phospho-beta-glucosidase (fragment) [Nostocoides jenkinsii Ben 74]|uniref:Putative 6-phospho-beta-glucosidase n=1 Tax=Nostocoides jenkinsii Ben 74 TaxID=1193518 RepID=A0A077M5N6_9MICO
MAAARGVDAHRHEEDLVSGGYEGVALSLMRALAGGIPAQLILNVRAGAQVGLPDDAVAEVPCAVTARGVSPRPTTPLDLHMQGLVAQVKDVERATIEAATTGSRAAAVRAFALHPLIDSVTTARVLVRDYCAANPTIGAVLRSR